MLHTGKLISLYPASSLFGTQQQLTHPPVKSSTLPLRRMPVFQGVATWHTVFISFCVIPLWDSATAHSPSGKEFHPSFRKIPVFQGVGPSHTIFTSSCVIPRSHSATAHSPSGKGLKLSSLGESFSGVIVLLMFSHCPAWALFGLILTSVTH